MNSQVQPWVEEQDAIQQLALEECVKRQRVEHDVRVLILPAGRCRLAGRFDYGLRGLFAWWSRGLDCQRRNYRQLSRQGFNIWQKRERGKRRS